MIKTHNSIKLKFTGLTILLLTISFLMVSCSSGGKSEGKNETREKAPAKQVSERKAIDPANMDTTVKPGDDFYSYANGVWVKNNPVPPEFARWHTLDIMRHKSANDLRILLEAALQDESAAEGSNRQKIRDFYAVAMAEACIETQGASPLKDVLDMIASVDDKKRFREVFTQLHMMGIHPMFNISAETDLGDAVGQLYVAEYFPPQAKARMTQLVQTLRQVLAERIGKLEWMSAETKKKALEKLAACRVKIGYPDKWTDYSELEVKKDSYVKNMLRASRFYFRRQLDQMGNPPDKTLFAILPQSVDAGYVPWTNQLVFPAGILQPPFFDFEADDAVFSQKGFIFTVTDGKINLVQTNITLNVTPFRCMNQGQGVICPVLGSDTRGKTCLFIDAYIAT